MEALLPRIEQYSIDEMFLDIRDIGNSIDFEAFGRQLREHVHPGTVLAIGVGIGRQKHSENHCNRCQNSTKQSKANGEIVLAAAGRGIWGVGLRSSKKLNTMDITTALQLARANLHLSGKTSIWFWKERFGSSTEKAVSHRKKHHHPNSR